MNVGLLLNVDYRDPIALARAREILTTIDNPYLTEEEAIDAFYIHYRKPIFGGISSERTWAEFVKLYVSSYYYREIAEMCRLNPKASREAATRLLRAYLAFLSSFEVDKRAWFGRGKWFKWVMDAKRQIRRFFGDPADVYKLYASLKKLGEAIGEGKKGDPAALTLSLASDRSRLKLAEVLKEAAELISVLGRVELEEGENIGAMTVCDIRRTGSPSRLKYATQLSKALYVYSPTFFLWKLASSNLSVKQFSSSRRDGLYVLVDKSGSMYDRVKGAAIRKISLAAALAIAIWRRAKDVVIRFFDQEVYPPIDDARALVDALLRVTPSGGTSISNAVREAARHARRIRSRRYALLIITDGEDDEIDPKSFAEARAVFKKISALLIGDGSEKIREFVEVKRLKLSRRLLRT